jgi:hypothetical protein
VQNAISAGWSVITRRNYRLLQIQQQQQCMWEWLVEPRVVPRGGHLTKIAKHSLQLLEVCHKFSTSGTTCVYTGQESIKASTSAEALLGCIQAREYQGEMTAWTEKASLPIGFQDMPQAELECGIHEEMADADIKKSSGQI